MKQINYTGSSKLIARIIDLLNKKAPLPLDQQGNVDWGTDGKVLGTDGVGGTKWVDPGSGGGDVTDVEVNGTSVVNAQGVAEVSVPTKTSDLNNDSDFVSDASYVHTDENFTSAEKTKLGGIASGAEVNVQSDWNETDSTSDAYIANKPTIPAAQIQSDWTQADNTQADYIKNKPTIPTVNDGTLTIQQNGTTVGTFSANQSGDTTVNLTGGGGSGGHTIEDASGTDMSAEDNLQFADAKVTDDSGNSRTKVEVIRPITESQVSSITEDGVYVVTDGQQISINAADVAYNGGSVAGALNGLSTRTLIGEFDVNDTNSHSISLTEDADKFYFIELMGGWEYFSAISCSRLYSSDSWCLNNGTNTDFFYLNNNPSFSYAELTYRSKNSVTIKASNANVKLRIYGYMRK